MRIVCVVKNSITKDARVLKEALALAEAGHEVKLVGLQDQDNKTSEELYHTNIKIIRLPWKAGIYQRLMNLSYIVGGTLISIVLITGIFGAVNHSVWYVLVIFGIAVVFVGHLPAKFRLIYNKLLVQEVHINDSGSNKMSNNRKSADSMQLVETAYTKIFHAFSSTFSLVHSAYSSVKPIYDYLITEDFDVIHCHDVGTLPLGVFIKNKRKVFLTYDAHEYYEGTTGISKSTIRFYSLVHGFCAKSVDAFIVVNESIGKLYKSQYKKLPEGIVIMNATDKCKSQFYDGRLHECANLDSDVEIVLYQGGFSRSRGLFQLISSVPYFDPNVHLVLMGWGALEGSIRQHANTLNDNNTISSKIVFVPPVPNKELLLWTRGASVGTILYEDSGINHKYCTPNKLWEYPAAGVPILTTPRYEMKKFINKYHHGYIVEEPLSPSEIGSKINMMIKNKEILKHNCVKFINENNWSIYKERLLDLYEHIDNQSEEI